MTVTGGLGLNITYRNISNHGGTIEVETKDGEGTKFRVYLPILLKTGDLNFIFYE
jgi:signal transduction histidine kinase